MCGKSGDVVLWIWRVEEPLAERRVVRVGARARMSVGCAESRVWRVRYCLDCVLLKERIFGEKGGGRCTMVSGLRAWSSVGQSWVALCGVCAIDGWVAGLGYYYMIEVKDRKGIGCTQGVARELGEMKDEVGGLTRCRQSSRKDQDPATDAFLWSLAQTQPPWRLDPALQTQQTGSTALPAHHKLSPVAHDNTFDNNSIAFCLSMRISPLRTSNSILRACYRLNPISNPLLQISQEVTPTHPSHLTTLHFHTTSPAMAPTTSSRPHAIVISGPSGTGKSTILTRLFAEFPDRFGFSISHTTRQPRAGEQNGREYYFVSVDEFKKLIEENGFVEWAQFGGNFYGTSVRTIEELEKAGRTAVLDIEMEVS